MVLNVSSVCQEPLLKPLTILCVLGTRPEAIKLAPVISELRRRATDGSVVAGTGTHIETKVCVTGQHRQMLDQALGVFTIDPDYDLNVMSANQSLSQVAAVILSRLDEVLEIEHPDWVLVQGDTTTAAVGALAAFYRRSKVGHVEAGLRTFDKQQPFPEEVNRRLVSVTADLHFAPTELSRQNLLQEHVSSEAILVTGNPVVDALLSIASQDEMDHGVDVAALRLHSRRGPSLKKLVLVTAHRRENFGAPLEHICMALRELARRYAEEIEIVYPVHLNPHVQEPVRRILGDVPNITLLPPLDYVPLVGLMKRAHLVLTDSGGIQEEAPSLGIPVLVFRDVTERPEAVEAGTVQLVGTNPEKILSAASRLLDDPVAHRCMAQAVNPYGDGMAAERIVAALMGEPFVEFQPGTKNVRNFSAV